MSDLVESCNTELNVRTCLTRLQSVGLALVAEAGFISFASLMLLFLLIIRNIIRYYRYCKVRWSLIQTPADAYIISLFMGDLLQSIGASMDVKWVNQGFVQVGHYCTAQGAIQQLGETATAISTMVIALHTFAVVWLRVGATNMKVAYGVIALTWLFVILFVSIASATNRSYYNPDTYWCWVGGQKYFLADKLGGEYIWLWASLFVSFLVYVPIFLWSRGFLIVDHERWWRVSVQRGVRVHAKGQNSRLALLAYPVAYSIVVLPVSIARWAFFTGHKTPDAATFFSVFLHDIFGAVNVLLLLTTKPNLLLFADPRQAMGPTQRLVQRQLNPQGRAPGGSPSRSRSPDPNRAPRTSKGERDSIAKGDVVVLISEDNRGPQRVRGPTEDSALADVIELVRSEPERGQWQAGGAAFNRA